MKTTRIVFIKNFIFICKSENGKIAKAAGSGRVADGELAKMWQTWNMSNKWQSGHAYISVKVLENATLTRTHRTCNNPGSVRRPCPRRCPRPRLERLRWRSKIKITQQNLQCTNMRRRRRWAMGDGDGDGRKGSLRKTNWKAGNSVHWRWRPQLLFHPKLWKGKGGGQWNWVNMPLPVEQIIWFQSRQKR